MKSLDFIEKSSIDFYDLGYLCKKVLPFCVFIKILDL